MNVHGRVAILVAVATNGVIGRDNGLPWRLSNDLKRFKTLTMGHHMIMGRRTFDSIGGRPLPGRPTIVVTRNENFAAGGVQHASSVEEAIAMAASDEEIFICGGAAIYEQAMPRTDIMYITRVHAEPEGDTFFPEFDDVNEWKLVDAEHFEADEKNDYPYSFLTYERNGPAGHPVAEDG
ncbi:MAG: dihydrofolate reductase [Acidobacteriota bacterium]|jgi:dihydrofolate reductase|nr:dihydrofolate reductase [Acidobacteriota bacterium]